MKITNLAAAFNPIAIIMESYSDCKSIHTCLLVGINQLRALAREEKAYIINRMSKEECEHVASECEEVFRKLSEKMGE